MKIQQFDELLCTIPDFKCFVRVLPGLDWMRSLSEAVEELIIISLVSMESVLQWWWWGSSPLLTPAADRPTGPEQVWNLMVTKAITTVIRIRAVATPARMLTNEELRWLPGAMLPSSLGSGWLMLPPLEALMSPSAVSSPRLKVEKAFLWSPVFSEKEVGNFWRTLVCVKNLR